MSHSALGDLRRLSDCVRHEHEVDADARRTVVRLARRVGLAAVPMLGRELRTGDPRRSELARIALAALVAQDPAARTRVIAELRASAVDPAVADDAKVCALGLLAELGERGAVRFGDPQTIQRRSAGALAAQLETAADVASAADLMLRDLPVADIAEMVEVMAQIAAPAAARLASELCARLDASPELRARVAPLASCELEDAAAAARKPRSPNVAVLVDAAARLVVVATRKVAGERRWRRWAVLITASGRIEDCLLGEDATDADADPLVANLCADGYRVASHDVAHARAIVIAAARRTATEHGCALGSPYYLGRDLLDLGDAHLGAPRTPHPASRVGRALDLLATGDRERAHALLARDATSPDAAAALAACLLADHRAAEALAPLARAIEGEPEWPLHHWNLAAALHELGDRGGCYRALRRFIDTSAAPSALLADPDQPSRLALAERLIGELERAARLAGEALALPRRRRRTKRTPATSEARAETPR